MLAPLAGHAQGQAPAVELSVDGQLAASDNGNLAPTGQESADLSLTLRPRLSARWEGSGFQANLNATVSFFGDTAGANQRGRRPLAIDLSGSFNAVLIDPVLTVGGEVRLRDTSTDPYAPTSVDTANVEARTEGLYRISPRLELPLGPDSSLLATSDLSLADNGAGTGARRSGHDSMVRYERLSLPIGGSFEVQRIDSDAPDLTDSRYSLTSVRARASLQVSDDWIVGASIGHDEGSSSGGSIGRASYGLAARWAPGPRTSVDATVEHRFFGYGGSLSIRHRMPWLAFSLQFSRRPGATPAALSVDGRPGNLQSLLDSALTTRFPDPEQRREQVVDLLDRRSFDTRAQEVVDPVSAYPQLQTRLEASLLLLGRRQSAFLNLYAQTSRQLDLGAAALPGSAVVTDSRQSGGAVQFIHLLTPRISANASYQWAKISGLGARAGDSSDQRVLRFTVQQELARRTNLVAGVARRVYTSTVSGQAPFDENRVFVGISHRF